MNSFNILKKEGAMSLRKPFIIALAYTIASFWLLPLSFSRTVLAQYGSTKSETRPTIETQVKGGTAPTLTAVLVDKEKKAQKKEATVQVTVTNFKLMDPVLAQEKPVAGEGHLHYQVDGGFIIATPSPKLSFHGLASGTHKIVVMLAGNDHAPLGPQATLSVTVP